MPAVRTGLALSLMPEPDWLAAALPLFEAGAVELQLSQPWFVASSAINALRRDAIAAHEAARLKWGGDASPPADGGASGDGNGGSGGSGGGKMDKAADAAAAAQHPKSSRRLSHTGSSTRCSKTLSLR